MINPACSTKENPGLGSTMGFLRDLPGISVRHRRVVGDFPGIGVRHPDVMGNLLRLGCRERRLIAVLVHHSIKCVSRQANNPKKVSDGFFTPQK